MSNARPLSKLAGVACALGVVGCVTAAGGGFDQLPAEEQAMFRRCSQPLAARLCADGSQTCLDKQAATFAARRSSRTRRNWLLQNECSAALIDAADKPVADAEPAPAAAPEPVQVAAAPEVVAPPPAPEVPAPPPAPEVAPSPAPAPALLAAGASCRRSGECESDLCVRGECVTLTALELSRACTPAPAPEAPPVAAPTVAAATPAARSLPLSKERLAADHAAPEQLRSAIVGHEADMKKCVERQLKLVPDLRAEGTLVLEVDAGGRVTQAALRGERLQGTALEGCVRALATRWVFPRKARGYAVEAPLSVSGVP